MYLNIEILLKRGDCRSVADPGSTPTEKPDPAKSRIPIRYWHNITKVLFPSQYLTVLKKGDIPDTYNIAYIWSLDIEKCYMSDKFGSDQNTRIHNSGAAVMLSQEKLYNST